MEKKEKIIVIVLFIILIIIGLLICIEKFNLFDQNDKEAINSTVYLDEFVKISKPDDIKIEYNIYSYNKKIAFVITNNGKDILSSEISIIFKDNNGNTISSDKQSANSLKKGNSLAIEFEIPEITGYAGDIEVSFIPTYLDKETTSLDSSKITFDISKTANQENYINNFSLKALNPYPQKINYLLGVLILYKDDKIVAFSMFSTKNVSQDDYINVTVPIPFVVKNNEAVELEYDKAIVNINYLS